MHMKRFNTNLSSLKPIPINSLVSSPHTQTDEWKQTRVHTVPLSMRPRRTLSPQAAISRVKVSFRGRGVHVVWYDLSITHTASEEYFLHLNLSIMSYCAGTAFITLRFWTKTSVGRDRYVIWINICIEEILLISGWMNPKKMNDIETDKVLQYLESKHVCPSVLTASSLTACQWPAGVDIIGLKNNSITLR